MTDSLNGKKEVENAYRRRAPGYNRVVRLFDSFAWFGFNLSGWRRQAIAALNLKPGDTVVDIGCGTGSNFPLLVQAVGAEGKIIAVDLSDAMLVEARQFVEANHWGNFQLVCADAAQFAFPDRVDAVVSAFAFILIPESERIVNRACDALAPGGRLVILDMAWPRYLALWWRHVLFFMRAYGVTLEVLRRRSWETVQRVMRERLSDVSQRQFWFGFFYLAVGTAKGKAEAI